VGHLDKPERFINPSSLPGAASLHAQRSFIILQCVDQD
jgi:hypothetical protein